MKAELNFTFENNLKMKNTDLTKSKHNNVMTAAAWCSEEEHIDVDACHRDARQILTIETHLCRIHLFLKALLKTTVINFRRLCNYVRFAAAWLQLGVALDLSWQLCSNYDFLWFFFFCLGSGAGRQWVLEILRALTAEKMSQWVTITLMHRKET